ncbi:uncharacterized protein COLE_01680 [Cutaneotrichosporon oleaginosum]|nr:hypothetical protein COLE_01680 [Cutaneotrichosporon oleaginosum]
MAAVFFGVGYYPAEYGGVPPPAYVVVRAR